MNERLAASASPYLRAHADNPVAWFAWGEEAFAEARRRDVPVMVSIGYSTCHWCHVMARESFQDAATAAELDEGFVSIKVDREEHPEVDAAYMAGAAAFTPHLGWPLTVFATPEGAPFFAGTYFPPEPRSGIPAFRQVLAAVSEAWLERREQVEGTADAVRSALAEASAASGAETPLPSLDEVAVAASALAAREDRTHGGFGTGEGPKFPVATALRFLLAVRSIAPNAAAVADRAFAAMAGSELRDDVEGGFFRYATRPDWTVPHFERMLTDNAQLLDVATRLGDETVARGIAGYLTGVLQQPGGGFGAAQDSESWIDGARSEGGYYALDAASRRSLEPPAVDGKVVTGWNGLAIGALARAGLRFAQHGWIEAAQWAADAVLENNEREDGVMARASLDEVASRARATLADHAQLAGGLLALAVATGEVAYAVTARRLVDLCLGPDGDPRTPGGRDEVLTAQGVTVPDAASDADEPSGPAALAEAAFGLWALGAGEGYRGIAERVVARHAAAALAQPLSHGTLLRVATALAGPPHQLVVVSGDPSAPLVRAARGIAADVVAILTPADAAAFAAAGFALFAGKTGIGGAPTAYDCRAFACRLPVTDPDELTVE